MTKAKTDNKKGFTIIEVVLVLAIAGLIMMMVFIALPALQRSQRDTQRRNDMARLVTAVQNYQANHRNAVPTSFAEGEKTFYDDYLLTNGDDFSDPSTGEHYTLEASGDCGDSCSTKDGAEVGTIYVYTNATCGTEGGVSAKGKNKLAFITELEGAGIYCTNN